MNLYIVIVWEHTELYDTTCVAFLTIPWVRSSHVRGWVPPHP